MSHEGGTPHIPSPEWADHATFPTKSVSALWWQISDVKLVLPAILRPWRVMWGGSLGLLGCKVLVLFLIYWRSFFSKNNGFSTATCYLSGEEGNKQKNNNKKKFFFWDHEVLHNIKHNQYQKEIKTSRFRR